MLLLDVNVVLAAHRGDHPHHEIVRARFDRVLVDDRPFTVPTVVWASFFRLATNRRIFRTPTPLPSAIAFVRAVLAQPNHLLTTPGARHVDLLVEAMERARASGDLVPDAVLAALAAEFDAEVLTLDRDFLRFEGLRIELIRV